MLLLLRSLRGVHEEQGPERRPFCPPMVVPPPLKRVGSATERTCARTGFYYGLVDVKLEKSAETAEARVVDDYESKS